MKISTKKIIPKFEMAESAGQRGVRVDVSEAAKEKSTNKGQTLLPWRLKNGAGLQLRTMLIRHVVATNLHMQDEIGRIV